MPLPLKPYKAAAWLVLHLETRCTFYLKTLHTFNCNVISCFTLNHSLGPIVHQGGAQAHIICLEIKFAGVKQEFTGSHSPSKHQ